ncbi:type VI secretion protein VasK, partial [Burkholderia glumae]|nr:type VI secretion protein VasK [Burkholderia glumae]
MIHSQFNMLRKFRIDILSVMILVVLPGLIFWFKGDWVGLHSAETRAEGIVALCIVFVALYLWFSFDASSRPAVAARRIRYWIEKQIDSSPESRNANALVGDSRGSALRSSLRYRHGWRWRYRERWVLVAGDVPLVKRLAPGLVEAGYLIT